MSWSNFLIACIPIALAIWASYMASRDAAKEDIAKLKVRVEYLEGNYQKLETKIDRLADDTKTIRILLENKENRK